ncbi:hypothetical protein P1J78_10520 [Psychromarinibacter sp. C21-152]|uniref:Uncharacterized protein n=1 Tax=Psychromarinibacter sediminicola TaxID=3033385 RepID=A0AAE3T8D6_9RHOB|nr:hypothetical protein [Psychromarinibacter sediminicola]MDF0601162.1 hypothetical protein [Psychromarinibacter sediminicola]
MSRALPLFLIVAGLLGGVAFLSTMKEDVASASLDVEETAPETLADSEEAAASSGPEADGELSEIPMEPLAEAGVAPPATATERREPPRVLFGGGALRSGSGGTFINAQD